MDDDRRLLQGLRAGDPWAYETLIRREGDWMLGLARRVVGNDGDAEDAFQDACLSAFRGIRGFQGDARLSTWLHRIVVNAALLRLRSRRRSQRLAAASETAVREASRARPDDPGATAVEDREVRAFVRAGVDRLPPLHRAVFVLCDLEGCSFAEVGEVLGLSVSGTKSRLHRARRALRAILSPLAPEEPPRIRNLLRREGDLAPVPAAPAVPPPWPPAVVESPEPHEANPPPP